MKIEHIALWATDLDRSVRFYVEFFGAVVGQRYTNPKKAFESCFLTFASGPRLEIMRRPGLAEGVPDGSRVGLSHVAFSLGTVEEVDRLTERLRGGGFTVADGPRWTGDGVLDPGGNRVELTV
jgi:lactoylglutathione lyase